MKTIKFLASLILLAGIASSPFSTARAQTVPHREHCTGTLTAIVPGTMFFTGIGVATHFGQYSIEGRHDFDALGNILNGEFTSTAADGSTLSGIYSGTYTPLPDGTFSFDVHALWLEGTGRLEGVTGEGDVIATLAGLAPGSAIEYFTDGFLVFP